MTDYSTYYPMPYADALRLSHLEAQQYALGRISKLLSDDIMRGAFTPDEQAVLCALMETAHQRVKAGIMEFERYRRDVPVPVEVMEVVP